jgi:Tol biopolymer transport system component
MPVTDGETVRAQLGRILCSTVFVSSPRMSKFLRFVVETTLDGKSESIKEYVIAIEVFDKAADYDPQTDSTVRTEAGKLRARLARYYETEGNGDPVIIRIPKGCYVPVFEPRANGACSEPDLPKPEPPPGRRPRHWIASAAVLLAFAALTAAVLQFRSAPTQISAATPLTAYPGVEGPPSLSPDGNLAAFEWAEPDNNGAPHIWIKAVGGETRRRLTESPASEVNPAWSPDGGQIAFVRPGEGVVIISQLGGPERKVSTSGTHVGWAADSKSVLVRDHEGEGRPFGIYQISLDTLERRRLTQAPRGIGDWRFEVSPDGKTLAFIRYERPGVGDLYVVSIAGGEPKKLTDWSDSLGGVTWTPNGRELIYSVGPTSNNSLWRIPASGARSGRGMRLPTNLSANFPSISKPAPGRPARLAFQTTTLDIGLRLVDLETPLERGAIYSAKAIADSTHAERPGPFSPNADSIAFVSDRTGTPQLWLCRRDGSQLNRLTSLDAAEVVAPSWSPDGLRIAFSAAVHGNSDIYVVDTGTRVLKRLTIEKSMELEPVWSPNGRFIYYASDRSGTLEIWRMGAEGGNAMRITESGGLEPALSYDGQYLFYIDRAPNEAAGARSVRKLKRRLIADGSESVVLEAVHPFWWSVAKQGIYFLTREPDFDAIDFLDFNVSRVERKGQLPFRASSRLNRLTVSADGRWALTNELKRWDADLMLVDGFR